MKIGSSTSLSQILNQCFLEIIRYARYNVWEISYLNWYDAIKRLKSKGNYLYVMKNSYIIMKGVRKHILYYLDAVPMIGKINAILNEFMAQRLSHVGKK